MLDSATHTSTKRRWSFLALSSLLLALCLCISSTSHAQTLPRLPGPQELLYGNVPEQYHSTINTTLDIIGYVNMVDVRTYTMANPVAGNPTKRSGETIHGALVESSKTNVRTALYDIDSGFGARPAPRRLNITSTEMMDIVNQNSLYFQGIAGYAAFGLTGFVITILFFCIPVCCTNIWARCCCFFICCRHGGFRKHDRFLRQKDEHKWLKNRSTKLIIRRVLQLVVVVWVVVSVILMIVYSIFSYQTNVDVSYAFQSILSGGEQIEHIGNTVFNVLTGVAATTIGVRQSVDDFLLKVADILPNSTDIENGKNCIKSVFDGLPNSDNLQLHVDNMYKQTADMSSDFDKAIARIDTINDNLDLMSRGVDGQLVLVSNAVAAVKAAGAVKATNWPALQNAITAYTDTVTSTKTAIAELDNTLTSIVQLCEDTSAIDGLKSELDKKDTTVTKMNCLLEFNVTINNIHNNLIILPDENRQMVNKVVDIQNLLNGMNFTGMYNTLAFMEGTMNETAPSIRDLQTKLDLPTFASSLTAGGLQTKMDLAKAFDDASNFGSRDTKLDELDAEAGVLRTAIANAKTSAAGDLGSVKTALQDGKTKLSDVTDKSEVDAQIAGIADSTSAMSADSILSVFDQLGNILQLLKLESVFATIDGFVNQFKSILNSVIGYRDVMVEYKNYLLYYILTADGWRIFIGAFASILLTIPIPLIALCAVCCPRKPCSLLCLASVYVFVAFFLYLFMAVAIPFNVFMADMCPNIEDLAIEAAVTYQPVMMRTPIAFNFALMDGVISVSLVPEDAMHFYLKGCNGTDQLGDALGAVALGVEGALNQTMAITSPQSLGDYSLHPNVLLFVDNLKAEVMGSVATVTNMTNLASCNSMYGIYSTFKTIPCEHWQYMVINAWVCTLCLSVFLMVSSVILNVSYCGFICTWTDKRAGKKGKKGRKGKKDTERYRRDSDAGRKDIKILIHT